MLLAHLATAALLLRVEAPLLRPSRRQVAIPAFYDCLPFPSPFVAAGFTPIVGRLNRKLKEEALVFANRPMYGKLHFGVRPTRGPALNAPSWRT